MKINKNWSRGHIEKLLDRESVKHENHVLSQDGYNEKCTRCKLLKRHEKIRSNQLEE